MVVAFFNSQVQFSVIIPKLSSVSYKWVFPFFYDSILETSTIPKLHNF